MGTHMRSLCLSIMFGGFGGEGVVMVERVWLWCRGCGYSEGVIVGEGDGCGYGVFAWVGLWNLPH